MSFDNSTSKNFQYSTVAVAPAPPLAGLTLSVQPTDGARFAEAPFWAIVCAPETQPLEMNAEIVRVTGKTADKFTIERAQQGSVAQAIGTGWNIFAGDTAQSWAEVHAAIEANATAIAAETTRAEGKEGELSTAITTEVAARKTAVIAAEAAAVSEAGMAETNAIANAASKATTAKTEAEAAATSKANAAQAAAEAESIPLAQKGAVSGVASLTAGSIGAQPPAHHASTHAEGGTDTLTVGDLPSSVESRRLKALGNIAGSTSLNLAEGNFFTAKATGALTLKAPENAPAYPYIAQVLVNTGAAGYALTFEGLSWIGTEPTFATGSEKEYLITIIAKEAGKFLAVVGKGETGAEGPTGGTGARGETGPSSIEAMARVSFPLVNGNPKVVATLTPTQWEVYYALVVCPVKAKELKVYMTFPEVSGHVRTWAYDCGVAKAAVYSILAVSELFEPKTKEVPELIATLKRKDAKEWEPGELILLGVGADNTTIRLPEGTSNIAAAYAKLPGAAINGASGLATVCLSGGKGFSETTFKEAAGPKELGEAGVLGITAIVLAFACRWE